MCASGIARVETGREAELTLTVAPRNGDEAVQLTLVVTGWTAWTPESDSAGVGFERLDVDTPEFAFEACFDTEIEGQRTMSFPISPGRWRVTVLPHRIRRDVEISAVAPVVRIELGEPALLRACVVDSVTSAPIAGARVLWARRSGGVVRLGPVRLARRPRWIAGVDLDAPGGIRMRAEAAGFVPTPEDQIVETTIGATRDVELRLRPAGRLRVTLREGDRAHADASARVTITAVQGAPPAEMSATAGNGLCEFLRLAPGDYIVRVTGLDQFAAPEERTVTGRPRATTDAVVELVRTR